MADLYPNFASLALGEQKGTAYDFRTVDRGSEVAIIAPHGGFIEPGTSQIAEAIAASHYSFYSFEGLIPGRPHRDLHITSHRFDEPAGLNLVRSCQTAIAIHGRSDGNDPDRIWMGGRNPQLGMNIANALKAEGFRTIDAGHGLSAQDPENICNRGISGRGVQLELPRSLRNRLMAEGDLLKLFAEAVRQGIEANVDGDPKHTK